MQTQPEFEQRLEDLAARGSDPGVEGRLLQNVRRRIRVRRLRRVGAFGAGVAVAVSAVAIVSSRSDGDADPQAATSPSARQPERITDGLRTTEPGEPCPGARHAARVADLVTKVPVWTPAEGRLTDAWTCGSTPVLLFSDIQVSYESGWGRIDVNKKWADMVRDNGGSIETILGRPAYVHPADERGQRNGIMVVVGDQLVRVTSKGDVPISRVVELASSIELPPSLQE